MRFHNITTDDMLNGDGLRVVLWLSGCSHHCKGCQNPITWDPEDGEEVTKETLKEIKRELEKDYISWITFSGGDPLYIRNRECVRLMAEWIKGMYPDKTIWMYTGYTWEEVKDLPVMRYVDVLVDGPFIQKLKKMTYHWAGSTNQRVIDVQQSISDETVILWDDQKEEQRIRRWKGDCGCRQEK